MNFFEIYEQFSQDGSLANHEDSFLKVTQLVNDIQEGRAPAGRTREWNEMSYGELIQRGKLFIRTPIRGHTVVDAICGELVHVKKNQKRKEKAVTFRKEGEQQVWKSGTYDMMFVFRSVPSIP
jgi:hypothetical protein